MTRLAIFNLPSPPTPNLSLSRSLNCLVNWPRRSRRTDVSLAQTTTFIQELTVEVLCDNKNCRSPVAQHKTTHFLKPRHCQELMTLCLTIVTHRRVSPSFLSKRRKLQQRPPLVCKSIREEGLCTQLNFRKGSLQRKRVRRGASELPSTNVDSWNFSRFYQLTALFTMFLFALQCNPTKMEGNFGLKPQNGPKLPRIHARFYCNTYVQS